MKNTFVICFNICPLHRSVCAWITCSHHGKEQHVFAEAETIDAVWAALYIQVWQWVRDMHGISGGSSVGESRREERKGL